MSNRNILKINSVFHSYRQGSLVVEVLKNINLSINSGEIIALMGPSGSGKSTLLNLIGLLEKPIRGNVILKGHNTHELSDKQRTMYRRENLGFIYQNHNLLAEFTALENIAMPLRIKGDTTQEAYREARHLLKKLKLSHREDHLPSQLSGGEQQRVAIARALVSKPDLLIADEPTGNLDALISAEVFEIFIKNVKERGVAAIIATHNSELASSLDTCFMLKNGELV